jgi:trehalose synthase
MLKSLLAYSRGAGIDARWLVIGGDAEFFAITKRLHNRLHGARGDGGALDDAARVHYREVLAANLRELAARIGPEDIVLLHDPQTAGLVDGLRPHSTAVIWRCHIGSDVSSAETEEGWGFLRPFVRSAAACIFSRRQYAPEWPMPTRRQCCFERGLSPVRTGDDPPTLNPGCAGTGAWFSTATHHRKPPDSFSKSAAGTGSRT